MQESHQASEGRRWTHSSRIKALDSCYSAPYPLPAQTQFSSRQCCSLETGRSSLRVEKPKAITERCFRMTVDVCRAPIVLSVGGNTERVTREEDLSSDQTQPPAGQVPFIYPTGIFISCPQLPRFKLGNQHEREGASIKGIAVATGQNNWTTWTWVWDGQQERRMAMA